jgi:transposase-like protein
MTRRKEQSAPARRDPLDKWAIMYLPNTMTDYIFCLKEIEDGGHSALSAPFFHDEAAAYEKLESILWPNGPVCPRCQGTERITQVKGGRMGLWRCGPCKRQFRVTVGTVFESAHVPLNLWFQAMHLLTSSKKGFSSHQLHRVLGVTYKTAWFMTHRIREAMAPFADVFAAMGGEGKTLEIDETFIGQKDGVEPSPWQFSNDRGWHQDRRDRRRKIPVVTLVERGGAARSIKVDDVTARTLRAVVFAHADTKSHLMTDEYRSYRGIGRRFASHQTVQHAAEEYVRGEAHTNTVEGFFSIFKRGMKGIYQHCSEKHLHRYLAEFDFRYSNRVALGVNDDDRAERALAGIVGKRLLYRDSSVR